ncbi:MAG: ATP-binding protein [bacterium]
MVRVEALYAFMESNFDYLLVVDDRECVVHVNELFRREYYPAFRSPGRSRSGKAPRSAKRHSAESGPAGGADLAEAARDRRDGEALADILTPASLSTFRSAIALARAGSRAVAMYAPARDSGLSVHLKAGHAEAKTGEVFLFFGDKVQGLGKAGAPAGPERDVVIKELACLYRVIEWIEVSASVSDFFTNLPKYLSTGMLYPAQAIVCSTYQGIAYGQARPPAHSIFVKLVVGDRVKGEIRVGYEDAALEILTEEQKMLDEIGRTLSVALERKEFRERLVLKQEEEAEFNQRLAELSAEIEARTRELEEQKAKLSTASSYLDRTNRGWEETKVRLETMFSAIPDDVVLIDKNWKVVMTNREGIAPGSYCYQSFFGRDRPCEDCRLARILRDKTPLMISVRHGDRYLQVHALPVYKKREVDGILEFYRDVTLEKTYDQQLQQADKLASLGQLVSGIGHEINNPNQFIRGNIKIVKQALEDMLPIVDEYHRSHPDLKVARLNYDFLREHIMTLVDDMAHGSERIKTIVEGLRNFARRDEGLLVDKVDINTLIEAAARLVHQEVHKRADVELHLAEGLPTFIGNSQKIEQVLINLLVNASQAMSDDRKGLVTVRTRVEDKNIVVEVEDNGQGMNEKVLKQIFDPFFTTKRAKGGTGLGLSISYKIIEEHGGKISAASKPGVGTTFAIRIPYSQPPQPGQQGEPALPGQPGQPPQPPQPTQGAPQ